MVPIGGMSTNYIGDMSTNVSSECLFGFGNLDENSEAEGECLYRWRERAIIG